MNANTSICMDGEQVLCKVASSTAEFGTTNIHVRETLTEKWLRLISNKLELSYLVKLK